ncbi:MAG: oligosaccharide flippase family protein, partial [Limisphaerales bacterium]
MALFVTAAVGRHLGVAPFGLFSSVLALATMLGMASDLGVNRVVVRDLVSGTTPPGELLGTAFALRAATAAVLAGVGFLVVRWLTFPGEASAWALAALFGAAWFLRSAEAVDLGFQAVSRVQYAVLPRVLALAAGAALQLGLIRAQAGPVAFGWAAVAEAGLAAVGLLLAWRRWGGTPFTRWRASGERARRLVRESWPLFLATLYASVYYKVDLVLLGRLRGDYEAGLYAASSRIYDIVIGAVPILTVSLFPVLTRWHQGDPARFRLRYRQLSQASTLAALAGLGVLAFFREPIVGALYG